MGTCDRVYATERRERVGHLGLVGRARLDPAEPEAATFQRCLIVPSLAERLDQVADGRTVDLGLDVVPGGRGPYAGSSRSACGSPPWCSSSRRP